MELSPGPGGRDRHRPLDPERPGLQVEPGRRLPRSALASFRPVSYWPGGSRGSRPADPRPVKPRVNRAIAIAIVKPAGLSWSRGLSQRRRRVGDRLLATARRGDDGWCWPEKPTASPKVDPSLGSGHGRPHPLLRRGLPDHRRRTVASRRQGRRPLDGRPPRRVRRARSTRRSTPMPAVVCSPGSAAGFSSSTNRGRDGRRGGQRSSPPHIGAIAARANRVDTGVHWHDLTEILWGTAGVGCLLLAVGDRYLGPAAVDLATQAGTGSWPRPSTLRAGIRWSLGHAYEPGRRIPPAATPTCPRGSRHRVLLLAWPRSPATAAS